ncbi:MAG TPA: hypothetical protein VFJ51_11835 [Nitrososphaeraceae archaeon]|nr:hypothetical protein [Nitrososphaeraceae archaeon]
MKYRILIKMDSEVFVAVSLCVGLTVIHHKTSDALRLALYQIIDRNWQKYEEGFMPQPQLITNIAHIKTVTIIMIVSGHNFRILYYKNFLDGLCTRKTL